MHTSRLGLTRTRVPVRGLPECPDAERRSRCISNFAYDAVTTGGATAPELNSDTDPSYHNASVERDAPPPRKRLRTRGGIPSHDLSCNPSSSSGATEQSSTSRPSDFLSAVRRHRRLSSALRTCSVPRLSSSSSTCNGLSNDHPAPEPGPRVPQFTRQHDHVRLLEASGASHRRVGVAHSSCSGADAPASMPTRTRSGGTAQRRTIEIDCLTQCTPRRNDHQAEPPPGDASPSPITVVSITESVEASPPAAAPSTTRPPARLAETSFSDLEDLTTPTRFTSVLLATPHTVIRKRAASSGSSSSSTCCAVCLTDCPNVVGRLSVCVHVFCYDCILRWSTVTNRCPLCKQRFHAIQKWVRNPDGRFIKEEADTLVETRDATGPDEEDNAFSIGSDEYLCEVCNSGEDEDVLLLCDGCDRAYHTYCLGLMDVPPGSWFCDTCCAGDDDDADDGHLGLGQRLMRDVLAYWSSHAAASSEPTTHRQRRRSVRRRPRETPRPMTTGVQTRRHRRQQEAAAPLAFYNSEDEPPLDRSNSEDEGDANGVWRSHRRQQRRSSQLGGSASLVDVLQDLRRQRRRTDDSSRPEQQRHHRLRLRSPDDDVDMHSSNSSDGTSGDGDDAEPPAYHHSTRCRDLSSLQSRVLHRIRLRRSSCGADDEDDVLPRTRRRCHRRL